MFATCFYAILDPESGRHLYATAGYNLPCCRHEEGQTDELAARGMLLGLTPEMSYEVKEAVLAPGTARFSTPTGLIEAHNPQGQMYRTLRLRNLLSEGPGGGADLHATLMKELERFTGEGWEQEDDVTLLTLEHSASRS